MPTSSNQRIHLAMMASTMPARLVARAREFFRVTAEEFAPVVAFRPT